MTIETIKKRGGYQKSKYNGYLEGVILDGNWSRGLGTADVLFLIWMLARNCVLCDRSLSCMFYFVFFLCVISKKVS